MSGTAKAKGGRKNRKWGRNKAYCEVYRRTNRREVNKLRRLKKHLLRQPNDNVAKACVDNLHKIVKG